MSPVLTGTGVTNNKVLDILMAFDHGDIAALALLNCRVAFDTVDHDILLRKLIESFGVDDTALQWLTSYLRGRLQCVRYGMCPTGISPQTTPVHHLHS